MVVKAPAPANSFVAAPGAIEPGASSTLAWNVSYAATVTINQGVGALSHLRLRCGDAGRDHHLHPYWRWAAAPRRPPR